MLLRGVLEKAGAYNSYYKNFYLAARLWLTQVGGQRLEYERMKELCEAAIASEDGERLKDDLDSYNLLHYWLGLSYLKTGDVRRGTISIRRFLTGVDRVEDLEEGLAKERRRVIGKAIEEKRKAWEMFAVILGIAGTVASLGVSIHGIIAAQSAAWGAEGTYYSMQQLLAAEQAAQSAAQNILQQAMLMSALVTVASSVTSQISAAQLFSEGGEATKRLAGLVSPLAIKLARYLNKYEQVELYMELAKANEHLGRRGRAIRFYGEALDIMERQRSTIASESLRINFFAMSQEAYAHLVDLLIAENRADEAFEVVERAKGRAMLDVLARPRSLELRSTEETAAFERLLRRKEEVTGLLDHGKVSLDQLGTLVGEEVKRDIGVAADQKEAAPQMEVYGLASPSTVRAKEALRLTREGYSIVEYFLSKLGVYIFVLDAERLQVRHVSVPEGRLYHLIEALRQGMTVRGTEVMSFRRAAQELYQLLIEPIREVLTTARVYVVPHGWLHYMPFQALMRGESYLVQDYAITYVPSVTVLTLLQGRGAASTPKRVLVLADPDLGNEKQRLPFAAEEARAVSQLYEDALVFLGGEATNERLMQHGGDADVIHIAAHAAFDPVRPLESSIHLAGRENQDGRVTARDFYRMTLRASLVVLSGCQTALAQVVKGDELMGLVRGVLYSGTRSIVATLWRVEDEASAFLMEAFHRHLKTLPKDLALQRAQLTTMRIYGAPRQWAGFVLIGSAL